MFNYLTLLGWSPGNDREKLTKDEMITLFSLKRVKSTPAQFDHKKLLNLNGQYIEELTAEEFIAITKDFLAKIKPDWITNPKFEQIATLMQSRTKVVNNVKIEGWI